MVKYKHDCCVQIALWCVVPSTSTPTITKAIYQDSLSLLLSLSASTNKASSNYLTVPNVMVAISGGTDYVCYVPGTTYFPLICAQVLMCIVIAWLVVHQLPWSTGILLLNYITQLLVYTE